MTAKEFIKQRIQNEWEGRVYLGFYEDEEVDIFEMMELYAQSKSQESDSLPCVISSLPEYDLEEINEIVRELKAEKRTLFEAIGDIWNTAYNEGVRDERC